MVDFNHPYYPLQLAVLGFGYALALIAVFSPSLFVFLLSYGRSTLQDVPPLGLRFARVCSLGFLIGIPITVAHDWFARG